MRRALVIGAVVAAGAGRRRGHRRWPPAPSGRTSRSRSSPSRADAPAAAPGRFVVEDGIPRADAERLSRAALAEVPGTALSAERDDGLYEVEVRDRSGTHVELLLDDGFRVVGADGTRTRTEAVAPGVLVEQVLRGLAAGGREALRAVRAPCR